MSRRGGIPAVHGREEVKDRGTRCGTRGDRYASELLGCGGSGAKMRDPVLSGVSALVRRPFGCGVAPLPCGRPSRRP